MGREFNRRLDALPNAEGQPGSIRWLFDQFFSSERFAGLASSTQGDYRWLAMKLCGLKLGSQTLGAFSARAIRGKHADRLYAMLREESGHSTAHYACRFARRVWKWGARREFVAPEMPNPWAGMELQGM
jgi:hypothetical protein